MTARYDTTFRNEAIKLALTSGQSIAQTARDLGLKESTLYNWMSQRKQSDEKVLSEEFKNKAGNYSNLHSKPANLWLQARTSSFEEQWSIRQ